MPDGSTKLRVGLICLASPQIGGGKTYEDLVITALLEASSRRDDLEFVVFRPLDSQTKRRAGQGRSTRQHVTYRSGPVARALEFVRSNPLLFRILELFRLARSNLERQLLRSRIDIAYFLSPNAFAPGISDVPIISTFWDFAHRTSPEFPEVRSRRRAEHRDSLFGRSSRKSVAVVVESKLGAELVERLYAVPAERTVCVPFWALLDASPSPVQDPGDYVIYPAQFWPHKNHIVLIRAMAALRDAGYSAPRLLFTGSDQGNRQYVESVVRDYGLSDKIEFTGFVPQPNFEELLSSAKGLVMPTYFGPTNLPPIEALLRGVPVAVSTCDALAEHSDGTNVLAVEPGDVAGWADALRHLGDGTVRRPAEIPASIGPSTRIFQMLDPIFRDFAARRRTWGSTARAGAW